MQILNETICKLNQLMFSWTCFHVNLTNEKKSCMWSDSVYGPVQGRPINATYKKGHIEKRFTNFLIIAPTMVERLQCSLHEKDRFPIKTLGIYSIDIKTVGLVPSWPSSSGGPAVHVSKLYRYMFYTFYI